MSIRMEPQPFDTGFVGAPVYRARLDGPEDTVGLPAAIPPDAALVSLRVPADWAAALAGTGFREVERLVSLERPLSPEEAGPLPVGIRRATPADAQACAELAAGVFSSDRYHADPEIDRRIADESKRRWARDDVEGRAALSLVAVEPDGRVTGFNLLQLDDRAAFIDLIAVAEDRQGQGLGGRLIEAAIAVVADRADVMRLGTQETNTASLAMYARMGFRRTGSHATFHFTRGRLSGCHLGGARP